MRDTHPVLLQWLRSEIDAQQAAENGIEDIQAALRAFARSREPQIDGVIPTKIGGQARLSRDRWGVSHVFADALQDAYFALGFAMGQDRLWQLDYLRRRASGQLAQILGSSALDSDRFMRTLGLYRSAEQSIADADRETALILGALADGINAAAARAQTHMPIEFEILNYDFEPWKPSDSIAVWKWRWWMLSGRLDLIALQEVCKRCLPEDLLHAFLEVEWSESIIPGNEASSARGHDLGEGSNNWVVGSSRSASGQAILASDPHNALDHPSQWYEAHIQCEDIDAIGAFYLGTPGIYMGRTRGTCWGITNHLASGRDLYVEQVRDGHYLEGEEWQPLDVTTEQIEVRDAASNPLRIEHTARGPLINEFICPVAEGEDSPLSLRWAGTGSENGFHAMLRLMRSNTQTEVVQALEEWPFPNLNFVFADGEGQIGYHAVGTVPRRRADWLGFRPVDDPDHAWDGRWSFRDLPHEFNPERDWVATANNPPLSDEGAYVQLGHWADGYRFRRIRERIEQKHPLSVEEVAAIQSDICHPRAVELSPLIAVHLRALDVDNANALASILSSWDGQYATDEIGPSIFESFWLFWKRRVAAERFPADWVDQAADRSGALARNLLLGKNAAWFADGNIDENIAACWREALDWLTAQCGAQIEGWCWGHLHSVHFPHPLGQQNERLHALLSPGPFPTSGGSGTVRAAGFSTAQPFITTSGSTYRLAVDMARNGWAMATTTGGRSGQVFSTHYANQTQNWLEDDYHPLIMDLAEDDLEGCLTLVSTAPPAFPQ